MLLSEVKIHPYDRNDCPFVGDNSFQNHSSFRTKSSEERNLFKTDTQKKEALNKAPLFF